MTQSTFQQAFNGKFWGVMRWPQLDDLWKTILADPQTSWYIYAVGEASPTQVSTHEQLTHFIQYIDQLLHKEHDEDYCGIVYADDLHRPKLVKIFDPNHLGSACGSSGKKTLPGWVLSQLPPEELLDTAPQTNNHKRWWRRLFEKNK